MTTSIDLPNKLNFIEVEKGVHSLVEIEPCYPGYGITLGNTLRRVLLSSLAGGAVTAVKIKGVQHEFMAVPGVKEDALEIILNLKQLRLRVHSDETVKLEIKEKGEKKITAKDINESSDVEIINKDLHIASLTDDKSEFEIEIFVNKGIGYVPTETRDKEKLEIGTIAVDAVYSPVKNVGIKTENVRVGQMTNYDKLILDIETDGTITPKEAFSEATKILIDHFNFLLTGEVKTDVEPAPEGEEMPIALREAEADALKGDDQGVAEPAPKKRGRPRKNK